MQLHYILKLGEVPPLVESFAQPFLLKEVFWGDSVRYFHVTQKTFKKRGNQKEKIGLFQTKEIRFFSALFKTLIAHNVNSFILKTSVRELTLQFTNMKQFKHCELLGFC